jgi:hypothetical protein
MPVVTIGCESLATLLFAGFVGAYKLGDPRESFGARRNFIAQVDQEIAGTDVRVSAGNSNRGPGFDVAPGENVMRYEAAIAEGPQQVVQSTGIAV